MNVNDINIVMTVAYILPVGWMFILLRNANARIDKMQKEYYDKDETKEMIALHIKPIAMAVENIKEDTSEIKQLIGKLFDEQKPR